MKTKIQTRITVAESPARVFEYLSNLDYHHLWNPQVRRISRKGQLSLSESFDSVSMLLGVEIRSTNVVTKLVPPKELQIENNTGMVHYTAHFKLMRRDGGTVVVCTTEVSSESNAFAFAKPILKALARRELQSDMQALKLAVEHQLQ